MDAAKIIEEIILLPEDEQGKVVEFVEGLKQIKTIRYVDEASFKKIAEKVFDDHVPLFEKLAQ